MKDAVAGALSDLSSSSVQPRVQAGSVRSKAILWSLRPGSRDGCLPCRFQAGWMLMSDAFRIWKPRADTAVYGKARGPAVR